MKIIITCASAGAGHFKAAEAIYNYIKEHCPGIEVSLLDILGKANNFFKFSYTLGYSLLIRRMHTLWRLAFWLTDFKPIRPLVRPIAKFCGRINTGKFAEFLVKEKADVVISTHFLTSEVTANLKRLKKIKSRLVTVITDFGVHPFWISYPTDLYIVASEFTKECLLLEGIAENNIKVSGIPVASKFLKSYNKEELRKKFAIDKDRFTVLIMTGSFGLGPLEDIARVLCKDAQVLIVCAANKKLYKRLKAQDLPAVKVFGFVDNAEELMAVSDVIITKPGGLTISEVLCMELAPIFISSIPGQEAVNAKVLEEYGIGISARRIEDVKNIVLDYRDHPDKLKNINDKIKQVRKPDTLKDICDVVCQGSAGDSSPRPF